MILYFTFLVERYFPEGIVNNLICIALLIWFLYYLLKAFRKIQKDYFYMKTILKLLKESWKAVRYQKVTRY